MDGENCIYSQTFNETMPVHANNLLQSFEKGNKSETSKIRTVAFLLLLSKFYEPGPHLLPVNIHC